MNLNLLVVGFSIRRISLFLMTAALLAFSGAGTAFCEDKTIFQISFFSKGKMDEWKPKKFVGETEYRLVQLDDRTVLEAVSNGSASGLIKKIEVNITETPFLNWSWRIENKIEGSFNEKEKSGDDYAARIYVVVSGGIAIWNTRALNYVWARHSEKEDIWPNAFAPDNARMIALRSSEARTGQWYTEKRDIRKDFRRIFGRDINTIDAVVLMTDTDNTMKNAKAYYGDIFFSSK